MSIKTGFALALGAALCACASGAAANLVQNGDFETTTLTGPGSPTGALANWTAVAPEYLWFPGTADACCSNPNRLWGPGTGAANGFTATSPTGGNFLEQDPFFNTPLSQTITGLTPGANYKLSFYWAGATWTGAAYATTMREWQVSLGTQTFHTATSTLPAQGFSGWMHQSFIFTPAGSTEVLTFLSQGSGDPPVALLDGISLNEGIPEPAGWALMLMGVGGLGAAARRRRAVGVLAA